jgi:hypothetical protein
LARFPQEKAGRGAGITAARSQLSGHVRISELVQISDGTGGDIGQKSRGISQLINWIWGKS